MIGSVEDKKKSRRRLRGQKKNSVFWIAVKTEVKNFESSAIMSFSKLFGGVFVSLFGDKFRF